MGQNTDQFFKAKWDYFEGDLHIDSIKNGHIRDLLESICNHVTPAGRDLQGDREWDGKPLRDFLVPSKNNPEYRLLQDSCTKEAVGISFGTLVRLNSIEVSYDAILSAFCLVAEIREKSLTTLLAEYMKFLDLKRKSDLGYDSLPTAFNNHNNAVDELRKLYKSNADKDISIEINRDREEPISVSMTICYLRNDKQGLIKDIKKYISKNEGGIDLLEYVITPNRYDADVSTDLDLITDKASIVILIVGKKFEFSHSNNRVVSKLTNYCEEKKIILFPTFFSSAQFELTAYNKELFKGPKFLMTNGREGLFSEISRALKHIRLGTSEISDYQARLEEKERGRFFIENSFKDEASLYGNPLQTSLAVIDIDDMTKINKVHGADIGNLVIKTVQEIIRESVFHASNSGRCGDDTFYCLIYNESPKFSANIFDNLRKAIERFDWGKLKTSLRVTCSIGFGSFQSDTEECVRLAVRAAIGMNHAKERGGNCTVKGPEELSIITKFVSGTREHFS